jgi:Transglycosylase SLT domain
MLRKTHAPTIVTFALTAAAIVAGSATAWAVVWKRTRPDGTEEFTNRPPPAGAGWTAVKGTNASPGRASRASTAGGQTGGSVIWGRQNEDGTVEFTNLNPTGKSWKVLYRTGPGKAAAVRGPSDLVPPRDTSSARFSRYDRHIRDQQAFFGIPIALVRAVIKTESDYDPRVVSSAGCVGLMQLAPSTAREMGVTDIWDPRQNIMGGSRYLQVLARRYCRTPARGVSGFICAQEELVRVIAGYHAGPGAVDKFGGMPPYETTRAYVANVLSRYEEYRHKEGARALALSEGKP